MSEIDWSDGIGEDDEPIWCAECGGAMFETTRYVAGDVGDGHIEAIATCADCRTIIVLDEWS